MSSIEIAKHPHLMDITTFGWISLGFSLGLLQISISIAINIYIYTLYMYICICILDIISYPLAKITDLYSWRINPPKTKTGTSNQKQRSSGHLPGFQVYTPCSDMFIQDTNSPETQCIPGPIWICNKTCHFFLLHEFTRYNIEQYTTLQWYVKRYMTLDIRGHLGWGEGMTGPSKYI